MKTSFLLFLCLSLMLLFGGCRQAIPPSPTTYVQLTNAAFTETRLYIDSSASPTNTPTPTASYTSSPTSDNLVSPTQRLFSDVQLTSTALAQLFIISPTAAPLPTVPATRPVPTETAIPAYESAELIFAQDMTRTALPGISLSPNYTETVIAYRTEWMQSTEARATRPFLVPVPLTAIPAATASPAPSSSPSQEGN